MTVPTIVERNDSRQVLGLHTSEEEVPVEAEDERNSRIVLSVTLLRVAM